VTISLSRGRKCLFGLGLGTRVFWGMRLRGRGSVGVSGGACYLLALSLSRAACCLPMLLVGADVVARQPK
jgi:hypothetical protein